ncbi:alpha/beta hydrolase family protein [Desulfosporosinus nitroreducens]|uniref:Alpha/beta hydrolase n=1 Tax=Desulfosporosinus nitroreducens TaxID=2018668 RepID=A0ABT8QP19_9FIRM|nr:alpha/beta hydrolase [Desulfosporosinus nitroreducens]MDO0823104.1 alpha/beta hydrolase [Desulfosporosinus nitroreducens]
METNKQEFKATICTVTMDRAIPNGFDLIDYLKLMSEYEVGGDYADSCFRIGDAARTHAENALKDGHLHTARIFFLNATAAYRVGQYTIVPDIDKKLNIYRKLIQCYSEAAKLYTPQIEKVEIPYKGCNMVGWLRIPEKIYGRIPVVISIGGADGWREEHHNYSDFYAERGMAYLMIDGPGQGETRLFNKLYMELDNEEALNEIVEYISRDNRFYKIGMIGYSFGGYLVARAAAISNKLDACVVNGGSYYPKEILNFIPHFIRVFSALTNKKGEELEKFIKGMTMEGYAERITCPLLLNHGKPDRLFAVSGIQRIYEEAPSRNKTVKLWNDGNHCVTNHATEVITMITDWFAETLN